MCRELFKLARDGQQQQQHHRRPRPRPSAVLGTRFQQWSFFCIAAFWMYLRWGAEVSGRCAVIVGGRVHSVHGQPCNRWWVSPAAVRPALQPRLCSLLWPVMASVRSGRLSRAALARTAPVACTCVGSALGWWIENLVAVLTWCGNAAGSSRRTCWWRSPPMRGWRGSSAGCCGGTPSSRTRCTQQVSALECRSSRFT
jgi:hypothetical protein